LDLHRVLFSLANITAQLFEGEPLSPEILTGSAPTTFPFGLRNVAQDAQRIVALHFGLFPADGEFSKAISDSDSNRGSHHSSLECFMVDPSEGHIESVHNGNTSLDSSDAGAREKNQAPSRMRLEQLGEQQKELKEARL
jgi:hypothetical protein